MKKSECESFLLQHEDEPKVCSAYLTGWIECADYFLNWAKRNGLEMGKVEDDDLPGLYAKMQLIKEDSEYAIEDLK